MFQLLKKCLILLFFYLCCVPVGCDDVLHVNGTEGQNLTVTFMLKSTIETTKEVYMYRDNTKIHKLTITNMSCFPSVNHTLPTICISHVSQRNISLMFTHLIHSGVYHLAVLSPNFTLEESNKVSLTVHPAEYTTTYTTVTAALFNNTSFQLDQSGKKSSILMFVPVLVVAVMLVIVLLGSFYWSYRRKTDKTPAVNSTSAPQIPDVSCVEYCVLDFPNRAGEKVRSTEERVEYSPIVFPPRKTSAQDNEIKSTTQQNKIKMTTLQHEERETDKVSEKPKTSKPKHQKCQKKNHT
ncbi:hypothetical protein PHYPO_G00024030 [Pangasianodon hypophthalmus]|uniref:Uncharacterized protein n=1 Tax=Pangasianodon hypophthalmus TaxID=310915 RepID=A0A5N5MVG7_PANHP|nr:uncharacterized protein LOC113536673 [Pangasianodon hypophthalmus]KAB5559019.1 hypothetical protein PHYPO_G00024030 [Pangasianodon hypophthalmus]